ncbi:MAG: tRNA (N6-isopentenyl adenosine(37)-C2)-methylthiotransferase MiaB [Synergistaceae bacterium]|nr:tRNA (N6-isopentenyl adenosine(37)-C2)-methylthiotransferase MiaB [Synergistaceae bacterium]
MYHFHMKIYGCQMNVYDSDRVRTALIKRGWSEVPEEEADMIIFVGCSVRDKAEQKVWSELGRYAPSWNKDRRPRVALTGCIAQTLGEKAFVRYPWVRLVSGPRHIGLLPEGLERVMEDGRRVTLLDENPREFFDLDEFSGIRDNKYRGYVTIAHGCDNFCTFCIVPHVRGRFLSRPPLDVLQEVRRLTDNGAKEITLLGQNVNSYGKDFQEGCGFAGLLRDVARTEGVERVRFVTSLPQDFTEDIVQVMAEEPNVCPSLNLPIQAGNDRILKRMNRKYTRAEYMEKVRMARSHLPELGLSSDLIVGFPGETEEEFQDSMSALEEIRFDMVHTAAYSERPGTPAAAMPDALPGEVRLERLNRINRLQDSITLSINKTLLGRRCSVLTEGPAPKGEGLLQGRTPTDKVVLFPGDESLLAGRFVSVEITEAESWCLRGKIVNDTLTADRSLR